MQRPRHAESVEQEGWLDVKVPAKNTSIEQRVVAQDSGVSPVKLIEPNFNLLRRTREPNRIAVIDLNANAYDFKARVFDILFCCLVLETELQLVVVEGLKVECD